MTPSDLSFFASQIESVPHDALYEIFSFLKAPEVTYMFLCGSKQLNPKLRSDAGVRDLTLN
jgi:hypothetical protein